MCVCVCVCVCECLCSCMTLQSIEVHVSAYMRQPINSRLPQLPKRTLLSYLYLLHQHVQYVH